MSDWIPEDDGTMPENVSEFAKAVVGHKIVKVETKVAAPAESSYFIRHHGGSTRFTLDDGTQVYLSDSSDCCAYTDMEEVIQHLPELDHIITAVQADDDFYRWHIIADLGEVLELKVGWSSGNPFYYGYGFDIQVVKACPACGQRLPEPEQQ